MKLEMEKNAQNKTQLDPAFYYKKKYYFYVWSTALHVRSLPSERLSFKWPSEIAPQYIAHAVASNDVV